MPIPNPTATPALPARAVSSNVFLRLPQVLARVPISRSTLWRRVNDGTFPRPLKLSDRVTVWRSEDIDDWMRQQQ
jgi:predicted DNA-binding transcriptional regulator AlpA